MPIDPPERRLLRAVRDLHGRATADPEGGGSAIPHTAAAMRWLMDNDLAFEQESDRWRLVLYVSPAAGAREFRLATFGNGRRFVTEESIGLDEAATLLQDWKRSEPERRLNAALAHRDELVKAGPRRVMLLPLPE